MEVVHWCRLRKDSIGEAYSAIIAEDPYARIPALALGKAVNTKRRQQGLPRLPVIFLSGLELDSPEDASSQTDASLETRYGGIIAGLKDSRAIMLSGALHSGKSTGTLATWLSSHNVAVDIAPPRAADSTHEEYVAKGVLPGTSRILTEHGLSPWDLSKEPVLLQNHPEVTGVIMNKLGVNRVTSEVNPKEIQIARASVQTLAEGLGSLL